MARLLAIDYGKKRCGIAVSDPLQIIATGLTTVETKNLYDFIKDYGAKEEIEAFVIGEPRFLTNELMDINKSITNFTNRLKKIFPNIEVHKVDERFTSKMAVQTMIDSGLRKKQRRNKALIDEISATLILQSFMEEYQR